MTEIKWKNRFTNPIENMRSYIRVHEGIDRHDRNLDVETIAQKLEAAEEIVRIVEFGWLLMGEETNEDEREEWRVKTIAALQEYQAI